MLYPVRILSRTGKLKRIISSEQLSKLNEQKMRQESRPFEIGSSQSRILVWRRLNAIEDELVGSREGD